MEGVELALVEARTARTRAYSACGEPVIHGRVSSGAETGVVSLPSSYRVPLSRKALLVESWNSYEVAAGTGFHANDGVRWKSAVRGSSERSRNPCSPVGGAV